jgi:hypothetical protein
VHSSCIWVIFRYLACTGAGSRVNWCFGDTGTWMINGINSATIDVYIISREVTIPTYRALQIHCSYVGMTYPNSKFVENCISARSYSDPCYAR